MHERRVLPNKTDLSPNVKIPSGFPTAITNVVVYYTHVFIRRNKTYCSQPGAVANRRAKGSMHKCATPHQHSTPLPSKCCAIRTFKQPGCATPHLQNNNAVPGFNVRYLVFETIRDHERSGVVIWVCRGVCALHQRPNFSTRRIGNLTR